MLKHELWKVLLVILPTAVILNPQSQIKAVNGIGHNKANLPSAANFVGRACPPARMLCRRSQLFSFEAIKFVQRLYGNPAHPKAYKSRQRLYKGLITIDLSFEPRNT